MKALTHKELCRRLRKLAKAIDKNITNANYGGCGVIAAITGQHLLDMGYAVEVVTPVDIGGWYPKLPAAKVRPLVTKPKSPHDWSANGLSRTHLAIRFRSAGRTFTWDTDVGVRRGCAKFGTHYYTSKRFGDGLTVDECAKISSKQTGWNPDFNRKQIPAIRTLVHYHLVMGL